MVEYNKNNLLDYLDEIVIICIFALLKTFLLWLRIMI